MTGFYMKCNTGLKGVKNFFSKCIQIRRKLWIFSHSLKKSIFKNKNDKTRYSSCCLLVISTIIGLAIFASEYDNEYFALKWSYAFGWGGALCMFAALVFNIIGASREKRDRVSY